MHKEFERRFGVTILEGYGLSETSPVASFSVWGEPVRVGSIGKPIPGVEMKLINPEPGVREDVEDAEDVVGEIAIKGPNIMKGYYGRPDATAEAIVDGWFRSGDLGRKDADGWYYIVDRSKDMIIRGGYNVYPREIEEVLLDPPRRLPGRRHRRAGREPRRGGQGGRDPQGGRDAHRGRAGRVEQGADGGLQVPAHRPVRRRAPDDRHRQDPQARAELMRALFVALGVAMVLVGAIWTGQGLGYIGGSPMTDQEIWAILGPLVAGLGVALVVVAVRRKQG